MKSGVRKQLKSGANRIMNIATVLCCFVGSMAEIVTEPVQDIMNVFNTNLGHENTTDLLEVFAGSAGTSSYWAEKGKRVSQPWDSLWGMNLRDPTVQQDLYHTIERDRPRLVLVGFPCRYWSPYTNINYRTDERKQELRRLRKRERCFLEVAEMCARMQMARGDQCVVENPWASYAWQEQRMLELGQDMHFSGQTCACTSSQILQDAIYITSQLGCWTHIASTYGILVRDVIGVTVIFLWKAG